MLGKGVGCCQQNGRESGECPTSKLGQDGVLQKYGDVTGIFGISSRNVEKNSWKTTNKHYVFAKNWTRPTETSRY